MHNQICWTTHLIVQVPLALSVSDSNIPPWPDCGGEHLYSYKSTCVYTCSYTIQMKYVLVATLTEYCSCNVYTGLLEPIRHSNIAPMGLSNEAGLSVDCGGSPHTAYPF